MSKAMDSGKGGGEPVTYSRVQTRRTAAVTSPGGIPQTNNEGGTKQREEGAGRERRTSLRRKKKTKRNDLKTGTSSAKTPVRDRHVADGREIDLVPTPAIPSSELDPQNSNVLDADPLAARGDPFPDNYDANKESEKPVETSEVEPVCGPSGGEGEPSNRIRGGTIPVKNTGSGSGTRRSSEVNRLRKSLSSKRGPTSTSKGRKDLAVPRNLEQTGSSRRGSVALRTPPHGVAGSGQQAFVRSGSGHREASHASTAHVVVPRSASAQVSTKYINDLKKDLDDLKRDKAHLSEFVEMFKIENKKLREQNDVLQVQVESLKRELREAQCITGTNEKKRKARGPRASFMELATKFADEGVLPEHIGIFQDMAKQIPRVVQYLVRESCSSDIQDFVSPERWYPNSTSMKGDECRDWRGRVAFIDGKKNNHLVGSPGELHPRGAIFMRTATNGDEVYHHSGCVPLCVMEQAQRADFLMISDSVVRGIIGELTLLQASGSRPSLAMSAKENILKLGGASGTLVDHVNALIQNGVGHRKGAARRAFFTKLGYNKIVAPCGISESTAVKTARAEEEKVASSRLLKTMSSGEFDTSWWRRASFDDICCPGMVSTDSKNTANKEPSNSNAVDKLFCTEASRAAFKAWRGFSVGAEEEASLMPLVRFDAWITVVSRQMGRRTAGQAVRGGGHTTWMKRQFRRLVPIAAENLLREITGLVHSALAASEENDDDFKEELVVFDGTTEGEILSNETREYTLCFRYPRNQNYYVALLPEVFQRLVCGWLGRVLDCYIGYSAHSGCPLRHFKAADVMSYVHESDAEDDAEVDEGNEDDNPSRSGSESERSSHSSLPVALDDGNDSIRGSLSEGDGFGQ